jgi:6,7-dimethyl-8-ribityllumazine synthase
MARIFIVRSIFNEEITDKMEKEAISQCKKANAKIAGIARVPGVFDMPLIVKMALARKDVDAVVTVGACIKGGTGHDEVIANAMARKLADLSCEYKKPVALGVIGPGANEKQAKMRAKEYAKRAVVAAIALHSEMKKI